MSAVLLLCSFILTEAWTPPMEPLLLQPREVMRQRRQSSTRLLEIHGWVAELVENSGIHAPHQRECSFYTGRVLGEISSSVVLTECSGLHYGLIRVNDEEYTLEPHEPSHVLRRREVKVAGVSEVNNDVIPSYNLTDDFVKDFDVTFDYDELENLNYDGDVFFKDEGPSYFHDVQSVSRPVTGPDRLWLELAVVADDTLVSFHGKERVRHYVLALMNIVSAIYNDPSLSSNMTLVISKLFLEEKNRGVIKPGNAKKSLEAVNKWNYRHLMRLPYGSGWDAAVWLTRAELGGPAGFAPVGGVCARTRSAALDREEGLTSAFVIAHELAHLLGLEHDGQGGCAGAAQRGSVMSPTVLATLHEYAWSTCSRDHFRKHALSWHCMYERSNDVGIVLGGARELGRYVFSMDEQCRTEFGEGFSMCKTVRLRTPAPCGRLWCQEDAVPDVCRTKSSPPLDGTPCAPGHWCVNGYCEPVSNQLSGSVSEMRMETTATASETATEGPTTATVEGGWSTWGEWSSCEASCGYSFKIRNRICDNPKPSGSGANCTGPASEVEVCWSGQVCVGARDRRMDICRRHKNTLLPYVHEEESESCTAWCIENNGGMPARYGRLPDHTPCGYDASHHLCYEGTCVKGMCAAADPGCARCAGDLCNNYTLLYTIQLRKGWTRLAIIPHEATRLSLSVASTAPHLRFALKERGKPAVMLDKHEREAGEAGEAGAPLNLRVVEAGGVRAFAGRAVVAGADVRWDRTAQRLAMTSVGVLREDLLILVSRESGRLAARGAEVALNYSTPSRKQPYSWRTEYGPCSASCGGGVRAVRSLCRPAARCPPPARFSVSIEACNTHRCEHRWFVGEWEECSASCGEGGVQERMLYCVPAGASINNRSELLRQFVSPALCAGPAPLRTQRCNHLPCPVYWQELPWTPCSVTCGRGWSHRLHRCPAPDAVLCGPPPPRRRRPCRRRRCPPGAPCPRPDASQYCATESLARACLLPPFRRLCCNACKEYDTSSKL